MATSARYLYEYLRPLFIHKLKPKYVPGIATIKARVIFVIECCVKPVFTKANTVNHNPVFS